MTEATAEKIENIPEPEKLTPEQKVFHVKQNMITELNRIHNQYHAFVFGLPINEDQKRFAMANIIQALHWAEDGIEALQFTVEELPPVNPEQPPTNQPEGA